MVKTWELTDPNLPEEFNTIKKVFIPPDQEPRKRGESLHDYLTRKKITCSCYKCMLARKVKSDANNTTLEL